MGIVCNICRRVIDGEHIPYHDGNVYHRSCYEDRERERETAQRNHAKKCARCKARLERSFVSNKGGYLNEYCSYKHYLEGIGWPTGD